MGGKSSAPPDYSAMAAANKYAADVSEKLGTRQMDFAERQYAEMKPLAERISAAQVAAQEQQMGQAKDYYDYQINTFRPVEQGLVRQAQEFDTENYREQLARQASADTSRAFGVAENVTARNLARRGVGPGSGNAMAMQNQNALALASARAGAATSARNQAEQLGWARKMDVVGLGRGLAGASSSAYQGATGAGSAGMNTAMSAGNQYSQAFGQGVNTQMSGAQMGIQGAGQILNAQTSYANANRDQGLDVGGLMAGGAKLYTAFAMSDRRLKQNIELVGRDERTMLPLYEFEYINGSGRRFLGVMAQDVLEKYPDMVFTMPDGFMAVNYAGLGLEMVEVSHAS
jgi:hypothetical protein